MQNNSQIPPKSNNQLHGQVPANETSQNSNSVNSALNQQPDTTNTQTAIDGRHLGHSAYPNQENVKISPTSPQVSSDTLRPNAQTNETSKPTELNTNSYNRLDPNNLEQAKLNSEAPSGGMEQKDVRAASQAATHQAQPAQKPTPTQATPDKTTNDPLVSMVNRDNEDIEPGVVKLVEDTIVHNSEDPKMMDEGHHLLSRSYLKNKFGVEVD